MNPRLVCVALAPGPLLLANTSEVSPETEASLVPQECFWSPVLRQLQNHLGSSQDFPHTSLEREELTRASLLEDGQLLQGNRPAALPVLGC